MWTSARHILSTQKSSSGSPKPNNPNHHEQSGKPLADTTTTAHSVNPFAGSTHSKSKSPADPNGVQSRLCSPSVSGRLVRMRRVGFFAPVVLLFLAAGCVAQNSTSIDTAAVPSSTTPPTSDPQTPEESSVAEVVRDWESFPSCPDLTEATRTLFPEARGLKTIVAPMTDGDSKDCFLVRDLLAGESPAFLGYGSEFRPVLEQGTTYIFNFGLASRFGSPDGIRKAKTFRHDFGDSILTVEEYSNNDWTDFTLDFYSLDGEPAPFAYTHQGEPYSSLKEVTVRMNGILPEHQILGLASAVREAYLNQDASNLYPN